MSFPRKILSRIFSQRTRALIHFLKLLQHYFASTLATARKNHLRVHERTALMAVYSLGYDFAPPSSNHAQFEAGPPTQLSFPNCTALRDTYHPSIKVCSSTRTVPSPFPAAWFYVLPSPTVNQECLKTQHSTSLWQCEWWVVDTFGVCFWMLPFLWFSLSMNTVSGTQPCKLELGQLVRLWIPPWWH